MTERLSRENAWAIYIDNDTLEVKWHTENLPDTVPLHYTISDIASLTRGYIDGYPTYTGNAKTDWSLSAIQRPILETYVSKLGL